MLRKHFPEAGAKSFLELRQQLARYRRRQLTRFLHVGNYGFAPKQAASPR